MVKVTKKSPFSGKENTMELPTNQYKIDRYSRGVAPSIQEYFPELNADQREFLMTGITPQEWNETFGEE